MKLPQLNENGSRLYIHIRGDVYSMSMYQDFNSVKELADHVKDEFGVNRSQFEYFYSTGV